MSFPSITVRRRVEWIDTDAAGIWHYSTVIRLAEMAELELHRSLGIQEATFGLTPRVHVEFDFRRPARFDDPLDVTLSVADVGRSSLSYALSIAGPEGTVATGSLVVVFIDGATGHPRAWPEDLREALGGG